MPDISIAVPKEKLKKILEEVTKYGGIELSEIESGFALDIPVNYEIFPDRKEVLIEESYSALAEKKDGTKLPDSIIEQRRQFVYIAVELGPNDEFIYQVFTLCGPENEKFYKSALLMNMSLPFGAFAISKVEGVEHFVLVDTYLVDTIAPEELSMSILSIARAGDRMEKLLFEEDLF